MPSDAVRGAVTVQHRERAVREARVGGGGGCTGGGQARARRPADAAGRARPAAAGPGGENGYGCGCGGRLRYGGGRRRSGYRRGRGLRGGEACGQALQEPGVGGALRQAPLRPPRLRFPHGLPARIDRLGDLRRAWLSPAASRGQACARRRRQGLHQAATLSSSSSTAPNSSSSVGIPHTSSRPYLESHIG